MGKYHALVKGNWERGLPMMAKGTSGTWQTLAHTDLGLAVSDGNIEKNRRMLALGWYTLAIDKTTDPSMKTQALLRAYQWYQENLADANDKQRSLIEAKLLEISALLPADESSYGFDNVTVGDLSPTLLERYLSTAEKVGRLAVGIPARSPGGDTVYLPPDLTQETHFDDLPLGTRGGLAIHYTFPLDAEYEIRVRLQRDRNEHVEGLTEAHDIELMLDGARLKVFTVKPPPSGVDHHAVDQDVNIRIPVKAGPHLVAAAFPKRPSALLETERQPYQAHFNMDRHPRITPAVYSITVNGPYDAKGPGDTPSRRKIFICTPARPGEEEGCAKRIFANLINWRFAEPIPLPAGEAPGVGGIQGFRQFGGAQQLLPLVPAPLLQQGGEFRHVVDCGVEAVCQNRNAAPPIHFLGMHQGRMDDPDRPQDLGHHHVPEVGLGTPLALEEGVHGRRQDEGLGAVIAQHFPGPPGVLTREKCQGEFSLGRRRP